MPLVYKIHSSWTVLVYERDSVNYTTVGQCNDGIMVIAHHSLLLRIEVSQMPPFFFAFGKYKRGSK